MTTKPKPTANEQKLMKALEDMQNKNFLAGQEVQASRSKIRDQQTLITHHKHQLEGKNNYIANQAEQIARLEGMLAGMNTVLDRYAPSHA